MLDYKRGLYTFLTEHSGIDKDGYALLEPYLHIESFSKGESLLRSGEICDRLFFLADGITRMYYFNEEAKEFTTQLSYATSAHLLDRFAVDFSSFMTQNSSNYTIEALTDVTAISIGFYDIQRVAKDIKSLEPLAQKVQFLINKELRESLIEHNTLTTQQRYENFIKRHGNIAKEIPQYIVASYLGITPVALSRLKSKIN